MHYFLGMEVWQGNGDSFVSHGKYANAILRRFHMESSKTMETPLAGCRSDRKSTSRGIFSIGSAVVSWYNMKQRWVALGLVEEEYMASSQETCEAIWMRKILASFFGQKMVSTMIYCNNQISIKLSENPVFHDRSKYIDIRYKHLKDCVLRQIMLLEYIPME
eukprot:PITA_05125